MIVIEDTSPLNYLVLIGEVQIIPRLYREIRIPRAVYRELLHERTPAAVRAWAQALPEWLAIEDVILETHLEVELDLGEREAIALAARYAPNAAILMDDWLGRKAAKRRGIEVTGTVGALRDAARRGWTDLRTTFEKLQCTNFSISPALLQRVLDEEKA